MLTKQEIREIVYQQLAYDLNTSIDYIKDPFNHFIEYIPHPKRRIFKKEDPFLKVIIINNKVLFAGRKDIIEECSKLFSTEEGQWFSDGDSLVTLIKLLEKYHYTIAAFHPFFIGYDQSNIDTSLQLEYLDHSKIMSYQEQKGFDNAFTFEDQPRDEIGIIAYENEKRIGVCGASSDSEKMWQIGIDVYPGYEGKHIGTTLVSLIKNAILEKDVIPFYGTAFSHIYSQAVAIQSGFMPFWCELAVKKLEE